MDKGLVEHFDEPAMNLWTDEELDLPYFYFNSKDAQKSL